MGNNSRRTIGWPRRRLNVLHHLMLHDWLFTSTRCSSGSLSFPLKVHFSPPPFLPAPSADLHLPPGALQRSRLSPDLAHRLLLSFVMRIQFTVHLLGVHLSECLLRESIRKVIVCVCVFFKIHFPCSDAIGFICFLFF